MNLQENLKLRELIGLYWDFLESQSLELLFLKWTKKGLLNKNQKLSKGLEGTQKILLGLELIPSDYTKGINLCPMAGTCKESCLAFSGMARLINLEKGDLNSVLKNRIERTFLFKKDRKNFERILKDEISIEQYKADLKGYQVFFRLNVFSDIDFSSLISSLPKSSFYDYTKVWNRKPFQNYHLTFSSSEKVSKEDILSKLNSGSNVAMVFFEELPETFLGFKVLNGDLSDLRVLDSQSSIVGLKVKLVIGKKESLQNSFTDSSKVLVA